MPGKWSSLNLAFLDPEALELEWSTVVRLASVQRMDLIIYYPQEALTRNVDHLFDSPSHTRIDCYFGSRAWRQAYRHWRAQYGTRGRHRVLMDLYMDNLRDLGYVDIRGTEYVGDEPLMRNKIRNAPLYRLIFASKHKRGHEFWHSVLGRNVHGQLRLME